MELNRTQLALKTLIRDLRLADRVGSVRRALKRELRSATFRRFAMSLFLFVFIASGFMSPIPALAAPCATGNNITIAVSCEWAAGTHIYTGTLTINAGVTVTALGNTTTGTGVTIIADNYVINGTIEADSNGYLGGTSTSDDGDGPGGGDSGSGFAWGASHGGRGSLNNARGEYGSAFAPIDLGSGGGDDGEASTPGTGGGAFKLFLNGSGTMTFGNGAVLTADGGNASAADSGGGAGGSIWIDAPNGTVVGPVSGSASVGAIGGRTATSNGGGAGGGGRIAMYAGACTNCANIVFDARGGAQGEQSGAWPEGGAGSIFLKLNGATYGDLIYDNNNFTGAEETTLSTSSTNIVDNLIVRDGASLFVPSSFTLSAASTLTGGGTVQPSITVESGGSLEVPTADFTFDDIDIVHRGNLGRTGGEFTDMTVLNAAYTHDSDTATYNQTENGEMLRQAALTLESGENLAGAAVIDAEEGFAYFAMSTTSTKIVKVDLDTFTRVGVLELESGEYGAHSGVIDTVNNFAYFGLSDNPAKIAKIDLSDFTRDSVLTLDLNEFQPTAAVIDVENGYAYFGLNTNPAKIIEIDLDTFTVTDEMELSGTSLFKSAVIDLEDDAAYFVAQMQAPGKVVKINVTDTGMSFASSVTLNETDTISSTIDTVNDYMFVTSQESPGVITRVRTSPSSFAEVDREFLPSGEDMNSLHPAAVLDEDEGFAYFSTTTSPGKIVRIDVGADTFGRVESIDLESGEDFPTEAVIDPANNLAYFATWTSPSVIVKTSLVTQSATSLASITIGSGATFTQEGLSGLEVGAFIVESGGTVTHAANTTTDVNHLIISATDFDLQSGGIIDLDEKGYTGGGTSQDGNGPGGGGSSGLAGGGGYGGEGGHDLNPNGNPYGSATQPSDLGSGGGNDGESGVPGTGGGALKITLAPGGTGSFNGTVTVDGGNATANDQGGGSGGSIWIAAAGATLQGTGTFSAIGGNAVSNQGGGGGSGGRIAIYSSTNTLASTAYDAAGGASGSQSTSSVREGGAGTIYMKSDAATYGDLVIDNNNRSDGNDTPHTGVNAQTYDNVTIRDGAKYRLDASDILTIPSGGTLTGGGSVQASLTIASGAVFNPPSATFTVNDVDVVNNGEFSTTTALTVTNAAFTHGSTGTFSATATSLTLSTGSFTHEGGTLLELASLSVPSGSSFTMANERYYPFAENFGALTVGGTYTSQRLARLYLDSLTVSSGGTANHGNNTTSHLYSLDVSATTSIAVNSSGTINVSGLGFSGGGTGADGNGTGGGPTSGFAGGGGHGGSGGSGGAGGGSSYGSVTAPITLGSGGGGDNVSGTGGSGGGAVRLAVNSGGTVTVAGTIVSSGTVGVTNDSAGGAGGSIQIYAVGGTVTGAGTLTANGGAGVGGGGGGSGGRIAVYASTNSLSAGSPYSAAGASGGPSNASATGDGGAGTVYTKLDAQTNGSLIVDNNNQDESAFTWQGFSAQTYDEVTIREGAKYYVPSAATLTAASGGTLTGSGTVQPLLTVDGTVNAPSATFTLNSLDLDLAGTFGVVTDLTLTDSTFYVDTVTSQFTAGPGNRLGSLTLGSAGTLTTNRTGTFYVDTLTANSGSALTHTNNTTTHAHSLNISATSTITINTGATVNLTSLGYSGGTTSNPGSGPGAGIDGAFAGGAGHGGQGGTGGTPGGAYGSVKTPTDIGSGGGGDDSSGTGGAGGGAIKLSVNSGGTITINTPITADGGTTTVNDEGGGSGGSIWINAPGATVTGSGTLTVNGGSTDALNGGGGGAGGRIAVYGASISLGAMNAAGGATGSQSTNTNADGGAGTIFTKLDAQADGSLLVDNNNHNAGSVTDQVTDASLSFDAVTIREGAEYRVLTGFTMTSATSIVGGGTVRPTLRIDGTVNLPATATFDDIDVDLNATLGGVTNLTVQNSLFDMSASNTQFTAGPGNRLGTLNVNTGSTFTVETTDKLFVDTLTVNSGGILTHEANTNLELHRLDISATTSVTVASGGTITANGKGFIAGVGPGNTNSNGVPSVTAGGGAGHGGKGGGFTSAAAGQGGNPYGSVTQPTLLGSGGGNSTGAGGAGGGVVSIVAPAVEVAGTVSANGNNGAGTSGGGGSGGSVLIDTTALSGSGTVTVNGGTDNTNGGGGGGGRIAVRYETVTGTLVTRAFGGTGAGGFTPNDGGAGTVFLDDKDDAQPNGTLIVDNNNLANAANTIQTCVPDCAQTYDSVILRNAGEYEIPNGMSLALAAGGTMSGGGSQGELIIGAGGSFTPTGATSFTVNDYDVTNSGTFGAVTDLTLMTSTFTHSATGTFSATLTTMSIEGASVFNSDSTNHGLALTTLNLRNGTYNSNVANHGLDLTTLEIGRNSAFNNNTDAYYPFGAGFTDLNAHGTYLHGSANRLFVDDLTVQSGGFITHASNTSEIVTSRLDISATSSVYVHAGGVISALGKGAPNGLGAGIHSTNGVSGSICGGGGSYGGVGGAGCNANASNGRGGKSYGSVTQPYDIGTGGGNSTGIGGRGGGSVKITAPSATIVGTVASGGSNATGASGGGGSGGSVWIDVTTLLGGGTISANGGVDSINGGGGSGGRVAVYYATDSGTTTETAFGTGNGSGSTTFADRGAAGTVFIDDKDDALANGTLVVANNNLADDANTTQVVATDLLFDAIRIESGAQYEVAATTTLALTSGGPLSGGGSTRGTLIVPALAVFDAGDASKDISGVNITLDGTFDTTTDLTYGAGTFTNNAGTFTGGLTDLTVGSGGNFIHASEGQLFSGSTLTVQSGGTFTQGGTTTQEITTVLVESGGTITHLDNAATHLYSVNMSSTTFTVQPGGEIVADALGFDSTTGPGEGGDQTSAGGGGHGGAGGFGFLSPNTRGAGGATYSSTTTPDQLGSGGGDDTNNTGQQGGSGGGAVILTVTGTFTLNGDISVDGADAAANEGGGGSGGSVWLTLGSWTGSGTSTVTATGGEGGGGASIGGGCGGGGRIYITYSAKTYTGTAPSVAPGTGCTGFRAGQAGSFVEDQSGAPPVNGSIVIDPAAPETGDDVTVSASATDDVGVAKIEIYLDGTDPGDLIETCLFSPSETPADCQTVIADVASGAHQITVISYDDALVTDTDTADFTVAGLTTENRLDLSSNKKSATATASLSFTLSSTSTGTLTLTFPQEFTVLSAPTSGSGCLSAFGFTASTMYATKTACEGSVTMTGGTVTNPSVAGPYLVTWTNDNGSATVYIVDDDNFNISATVEAVITFNVGSQTGTCDGAFTGNGGSLALGGLNLASVASSDVNSVPHICTRLSTNAPGGAVVTVRSQNGALASVGTPADVIPSSSATLVAGTAGYGLCAGSGGSDTGRDATTPIGASPVRAGPFGGSCSTSAHDVGGLTTSPQIVWSVDDPTQNAFTKIFVKAALGPEVETHNDYQDVLTFIATATF